jgi:hypothetical protein
LIDHRAPLRYERGVLSDFVVLVISSLGRRSLLGRSSVRRPCACDDRISLYPAAPFRLAILLHARIIAREGWGSSSRRQVGYARSANPRHSHTSDPPNAPEGASETVFASPRHGRHLLLRIAPCGTRPCSRKRHKASVGGRVQKDGENGQGNIPGEAIEGGSDQK